MPLIDLKPPSQTVRNSDIHFIRFLTSISSYLSSSTSTQPTSDVIVVDDSDDEVDEVSEDENVDISPVLVETVRDADVRAHVDHTAGFQSQPASKPDQPEGGDWHDDEKGY